MTFIAKRAIAHAAAIAAAGAMLCGGARAADPSSFASQSRPHAALDATATAPLPTMAHAGAPAHTWHAAGAERSDRAAMRPSGRGLSESDMDKRFLPTTLPVPEPNTLALMLAGLGVIGVLARRRKPR